MDLGRLAREKGFDVMVATHVDSHGPMILEEGFTLFPVAFVRGLQSPFKEWRVIRELAVLLKREKPDIVHLFALKSMMYGNLASIGVWVPAMVNSVTGLGHVFSGRTQKISLVRMILKMVLRTALKKPHSRVIFQNQEDRDTFFQCGLIQSHNGLVIKGSGVDLKRFSPAPAVDGPPVVLLGCRLLWEKGVAYFVEAASLLKKRRINAVFALGGMLDRQNPDGIPEEQIRQWEKEGAIEWWGFLENMPEVLANVHVVVLPSYYGEGVPKILLEGAACGKPLVATDVRGCREAVRHRITGLLVPPRDAVALAEAMEILINDSALRGELGRNGRAWIETNFSSEKVSSETMEVYEQLLGMSPTPPVGADLCRAGSML